MSDKKIYFGARVGWDEPHSYAKLADQAWVRAHLKDELEKAGVTEGVRFEKIRVVEQYGPEKDARLCIWGEEEPGTGDVSTDHEGLLVELDDKVVYCDMKLADHEDVDPDDHEDCEECRKIDLLRT